MDPIRLISRSVFSDHSMGKNSLVKNRPDYWHDFHKSFSSNYENLFDKDRRNYTPEKVSQEPPPEVDTPKSDRWPNLLKSFTQETSLHGIRYLTTPSRFVVRRILWALLLMGLLAVFLFYLVERVRQFLKYDISVSVAENYVESTPFPAITICNQNPFSLTTSATQGWYLVAKRLSNPIATAMAYRNCTSTEFRCDTGLCIAKSKECDSFPDCTDGSDEKKCNPCPRLTAKPGVQGIAILNGLEDTTFLHQNMTYYNKRPVYISEIPSRPFLVYFDAVKLKWTIAMGYREDTMIPGSKNNTSYGEIIPKDIIGTSDQSTANSPQEITDMWALLSNQSVGIKFECANAIISPDTNQGKFDGNLKLNYIYGEGSQNYSDLILSCKWKGQPCEPGAFKKAITDMGICYTFKTADLNVERPGPGFALTVDVNIAYYDYTLSGASGIQILMHDANDVPIMAGQSLAISPGLFSMVALERTVVENLEPPWGDCTKKGLKYYDTYTQNTCKLDCENEVARTRCGCRHNYMPEVDKNDVEYCTVDKYSTCLNRELENAAKDPKWCPCGTPCINTVYVPSLSFATLATDAAAVNDQNDQTATLSRRLADAREKAHRVDSDKYRQTTRIFNVAYVALMQLTNFVNAVEGQFSHGTDTVNDVYILAGQDCNELSKLHAQVITDIGSTLMDALTSFSHFYQASTFANIIQFQDIIKRLNFDYSPEERSYLQARKEELQFKQDKAQIKVSQANMRIRNVPIHVKMDYSRMNISQLMAMNVTLPNGTQFNTDFYIGISSGVLNAANAAVVLPDDNFWNHTTEIWIRFTILRTALELSTSSLRLVSSDLLRRLQEDVKNITTRGFLVKPELINFIQPLLRASCSWCSNSNNDTMMAILKSGVTDFVKKTVQPKLDKIQLDLVKVYNDFLKSVATKDSNLQNEIYNNRLPSLVDTAQGLHYDMRRDMIPKISEAMEFAIELLRQLEPKCEDRIVTKAKSIQDNHAKGVAILREVNKFVQRVKNDFYNNTVKYTTGQLTLADMARSTDFAGLSDYLQPRMASLQDVLRDRKIILTSFESIIDNIYFWFMAFWDNQLLKDKSQYWRRFNISNPGFGAPSTTPVAGDNAAYDKFVMKSGSESESFWKDLSDRLTSMVNNVQFHITGLARTTTEAQGFFDAYLEANKISSSFYSNNFLKLDVYYKAITNKTIVQQKAYEYPALLSELGGLLGLLLGASCITLIEFLDLLWYNCCVKCCERNDESLKRHKRDGDSQDASPGRWSGNDDPFKPTSNGASR